MKAIICIVFSVTFIVSCSNDAPVDSDTFTYFERHLKADMTSDELTKVFHEPDEDIGSGIHIYVYDLKDGTKMIIGYTDHIHYAKHVDNDFNELHVLI